MRKLLLICLLLSGLYSVDLKVEIIPDTAFVGSLIELQVSVENLQSTEIPVFNEIEGSKEEFTVVDKVLTPSSISYFLQFWKVGLIIIPSISVDIKNNNNDVIRIQTSKISVNILSNISTSSNEIRSIKPMKELKLNSTLKLGLLIVLIIAGLVAGGYLWNSKTNLNDLNDLKGSFKISALNESIKKIEDLPLPSKINSETAENYYLKLSEICRLFFNEIFYIKATEMTSRELAEHFAFIGIESELVNSWNKVSQMADKAKYANYIPPIDQFNADKEGYIKLITSFNRVRTES
ncbi:MAG TPA: hypothetical protein QGI69_05190 [Candidatus Marinimicrobia bacterium]|jgi:hypothetical protein|nr:hypothetical protein [Candidatus Neomarinimicrobiota bacterium]|tara:strand:- start:328 stop:1206 length:879 start_codon:yes stop_codon:yes gene_type:complete